MGKPKEPPQVKLVMSVLMREDSLFLQASEALKEEFGEIDFMSDRFEFDFTHYYAKELGDHLFRRFITFETLVLRESLPDIKLSTNRLEERLVDPYGRRQVNIDPGYLGQAHLILATTKAYSHRPYLGKGIYADLTLLFRNQSFHPLEWTYPDYRQTETIQLFNELRKRYLKQLRTSLVPQGVSGLPREGLSRREN